jgi:hypothetical protein
LPLILSRAGSAAGERVPFLPLGKARLNFARRFSLNNLSPVLDEIQQIHLFQAGLHLHLNQCVPWHTFSIAPRVHQDSPHG